MSEEFNPADYSVVVKLRGKPPKPWRWEIHRTGRRGGAIKSSAVLFETMTEAAREAKKALAQLLAKRRQLKRAVENLEVPREPIGG
jgi:hypothetical protein